MQRASRKTLEVFDSLGAPLRRRWVLAAAAKVLELFRCVAGRARVHPAGGLRRNAVCDFPWPRCRSRSE